MGIEGLGFATPYYGTSIEDMSKGKVNAQSVPEIFSSEPISKKEEPKKTPVTEKPEPPKEDGYLKKSWDDFKGYWAKKVSPSDSNKTGDKKPAEAVKLETETIGANTKNMLPDAASDVLKSVNKPVAETKPGYKTYDRSGHEVDLSTPEGKARDREIQDQIDGKKPAEKDYSSVLDTYNKSKETAKETTKTPVKPETETIGANTKNMLPDVDSDIAGIKSKKSAETPKTDAEAKSKSKTNLGKNKSLGEMVAANKKELAAKYGTNKLWGEGGLVDLVAKENGYEGANDKKLNKIGAKSEFSMNGVKSAEKTAQAPKAETAKSAEPSVQTTAPQKSKWINPDTDKPLAATPTAGKAAPADKVSQVEGEIAGATNSLPPAKINELKEKMIAIKGGESPNPEQDLAAISAELKGTNTQASN